MKRTTGESDRSSPEHQDSADRESGRPGGGVGSVATLHRAAGNQAVKELHERGEIQAKLDVSQPADATEREAERVADEVVEMDDARDGADRGPTVTRTATGNSGGTVDGETESRIESVTSGGRPLPESTRSFFQERFGREFSDVRVHTGPDADEAARSINAEAFTYGSDVVFRSGAYRPGSRDGRRLLAHELTHVVQQGNGASRSVQRNESLETAAKGLAEEVISKSPYGKAALIAGKLASAAADGIGEGIKRARDRLSEGEGPGDKAAMRGDKHIICKNHPELDQCKGFDPKAYKNKSQEEIYDEAMKGVQLTRKRQARAVRELDDVALAGLTSVVEKMKDLAIEEVLGKAADKLTAEIHGKLVDFAQAAKKKLAENVVGYDIFGGYDSVESFLKNASESEIEEQVNNLKDPIEENIKNALSDEES